MSIEHIHTSLQRNIVTHNRLFHVLSLFTNCTNTPLKKTTTTTIPSKYFIILTRRYLLLLRVDIRDCYLQQFLDND